MAKDIKTRVYEAMFLVDSGDAAVWDELTKHLAGLLTRNGAEIIGMTRWDERKLGFTIAGRKRGTYVLAFFGLASGAGVVEIERDCRLSEKVLRSIFLKADHFTVADMRMQLGEDINADAAQKIMTERGETGQEAAVVHKPVHGEEAPEGAEGEDRGPRRFDRGGDRFDRGERRGGGGRDRY